ncbi:MAG: hypothetical protein WCT36_05905 [Candidatus Gracilibacteria bacterium]|jgi:hypothetical protein
MTKVNCAYKGCIFNLDSACENKEITLNIKMLAGNKTSFFCEEHEVIPEAEID